MSAFSTMRAVVDEYLTMRRELGFALLVEGQELDRFARFADQLGHAGPITTMIARQLLLGFALPFSTVPISVPA